VPVAASGYGQVMNHSLYMLCCVLCCIVGETNVKEEEILVIVGWYALDASQIGLQAGMGDLGIVFFILNSKYE
jgi:hypothetical protein